MKVLREGVVHSVVTAVQNIFKYYFRKCLPKFKIVTNLSSLSFQATY